MLSKKILFLTYNYTFKRSFHCDRIKYNKGENPIARTFRILKEDFVKSPSPNENRPIISNSFPTHTDIVIIGGGIMGTSIAYWIKEKSGFSGVDIVVVEKDPTYSQSSTVLSVGGLRQQFSLPENIQMSLFGAEFLRTLKKRFGPHADCSFTPNGYLLLASEDGSQQLIDNSVLQKELGAINTILSKNQLKERFPWLNTKDVELGCLGLEKEGWFDPWSLLNILKEGAVNNGVRYINAEAVGFNFSEIQDYMASTPTGVQEGSYQGINEINVKRPNGEIKTIQFSYCILAAGSNSAAVAEMANIGTGKGLLSLPLPVEKRKRYVYCFNCKGEPPGINTPLTVDTTGCYFRRENLGGCFIAGLSPDEENEPSADNLNVDYDYFNSTIWPILANRVPAFESIKVTNGWGGYYEYNYYDQNGIIGPHPYYHNLYLATGFSGHGIQQGPAVGRAVAELILDGKFQTIDLTRLGFDRFVVKKPMYEIGIY